MRCSGFRDKGTLCKIFTWRWEVNKHPMLACWDQSKVWEGDMKAWDSMQHVGVGGVVVLAFSCVRSHLGAKASAEKQRARVCLCLCNKPVSKQPRASRGHPADPWGRGPLPLLLHLSQWNEENTPISNRIATLQSQTWKHALAVMVSSPPRFEKYTRSYLLEMRSSFSPQWDPQLLTYRLLFYLICSCHYFC